MKWSSRKRGRERGRGRREGEETTYDVFAPYTIPSTADRATEQSRCGGESDRQTEERERRERRERERETREI